MVSTASIPRMVSSVVRFIRSLPPAYRFGPFGLLLAALLLGTSLVSEVGTVDLIFVTGEASPGTAAREVPFNETPFFRATLTVAPCGVGFHLLSDADYATFLSNGRLPPTTIDCNRTQAVIRSRISHMVTVYNGNPRPSNVSYEIGVEFFAEEHPYALLSIPGSLLGLGSTIAIAMTMLQRGTDKLAGDYPGKFGKRK